MDKYVPSFFVKTQLTGTKIQQQDKMLKYLQNKDICKKDIQEYSTKLTWLNVPYLPYPAFGAATKAFS